MERFAADPTASVPKACQGWGETVAAYRFFDNDSVHWQAIMAPHWQQSAQRMAARPVVLCLQDMTELDFNGQGAFGLGPLSYEAQRGMYLHRIARPPRPRRSSSCRVEALQLGSITQLERALALFMVVAWRIARLMRLGRTCPDLDAELFFDPDEIEAAYLLRKKHRQTNPA